MKQWWRVIYPLITRLAVTELFGAVILMVLTRMTGGGDEIYYENAVWITGFVGLVAVVPMLFWYKQDVFFRKIGGLISSKEKIHLLEMILMLFLGAALAQYANVFLNMFAGILDFESYTQNMDAVTVGQSIWQQIFWMGIIAPFAEEVVFRWMMYLRLRDYYKRGWAIVLSGVIFGICHWNVLQAIYASLLGILFAYILDMSGNIWSCVLLHIGANTWSIIYPELGMFLLETEKTGLILFIMGALLAILILGMQLIISKGHERGRRGV